MNEPSTLYDQLWNPKDYLRQYYTETADLIAADEWAIQRFVTAFLRSEGRHFDRALELGCGPTLHHAVPVVPWVGELHLADYLASNREEVQGWLAGKADAHDWSRSIQFTLEHEGAVADGDAIAARQQLLRGKIRAVKPCDLRQEHPLGDGSYYDLVTSFYCAECACSGSLDEWKRLMANLLRLVAPGGVFLTSALRLAKHYTVLGSDFPVASIDTDDLASVFLEEGFDPAHTEILTVAVPEFAAEGFDSALIAKAQHHPKGQDSGC